MFEVGQNSLCNRGLCASHVASAGVSEVWLRLCVALQCSEFFKLFENKKNTESQKTKRKSPDGPDS